MVKYFLGGFISLLIGLQLFYIAKELFITTIPAVLLIIFSILLMLGSFITSVRQTAKTEGK
ncbi:hypothetical protein [Paraliobacillus salinarum]|uniref:hypothetical protein n=1 Tax=Paraliobacillus salinarum TaxID=1158996 RepID=UPI0015F404B8|nr:hypothetical protein [Paraliobacillus salinarum]